MIYVDGANIKANVFNPGSGRTHSSRWCHLFSDEIDTSELHDFASRIGLRPEWFQPGRSLMNRSRPNPGHDHYDVTSPKRRQAVAAGALEIGLEQAAGVWHTKAVRYRAMCGAGELTKSEEFLLHRIDFDILECHHHPDGFDTIWGWESGGTFGRVLPPEENRIHILYDKKMLHPVPELTGRVTLTPEGSAEVLRIRRAMGPVAGVDY